MSPASSSEEAVDPADGPPDSVTTDLSAHARRMREDHGLPATLEDPNAIAALARTLDRRG